MLRTLSVTLEKLWYKKNTERWILIQHSKSVQSSLYTIQHVPGILINKSACNTLTNSKWSVSICLWKSQRSCSEFQKSQNHTETLHYLHLEMYLKTWIWVSLPSSVFSISLVWKHLFIYRFIYSICPVHAFVIYSYPVYSISLQFIKNPFKIYKIV